jgi:hypothetical protein
MLLKQREEDFHDLLLVVSHLLPFSLKNKEEKQSLKNAQGLEKEKTWDINKRKRKNRYNKLRTTCHTNREK